MVDRLLEKLEPQRRHLASLVGLLLLTFVLTSAMALQAHHTQAARAQETSERVLGSVEQIQLAWIREFAQRGMTLFATVNTTALQTSDAPLDSILDAGRVRAACEYCAAPLVARSIFELDPATGAVTAYRGAPLSDSVLHQINGHLARKHWVNARREVVKGGLYFLTDAGEARLAVTFGGVGPDSAVHRVVGYVLDRTAIEHVLDLTFGVTTTGFPGHMVNNQPNDSVFYVAATAAGAPIMQGPANAEFVLPSFSNTAPIYGLGLNLALQPWARALLIPSSSSAWSPFLLVLLALVGTVLALALLLVRREAELVRLRAEFISGVSHELRTPLAQIRMFTETLLLGRTRSDIERRRSLEIIDQEARRLTHLVENVLLFSRSEGGRRPAIAPEPTQFAGEIRRAMEGFGPMCRMRSAEMRAELQENITAPVDRNALRQILINLLENALKYGPVGQRITVGLALFDDVARLWVDDEGPGIPVADRERVFDSFFRLRRDVESRISGSGIGLSVVRELAQLHHGDVRAETAPGGGARIVVEFPDAYLRSEERAGMPAAS